MRKIRLERPDLFDLNIVISMKVTIKADLTFDEIKVAYLETLSAHGILNQRIMLNSIGELYYGVSIARKNSIKQTNKSFEELVNENLKKRYKIEEGEFLRTFIDLKDDKSFDAYFFMHHLGGDGKSLVYFIESFARALNKEKLEYNNLVLFTEGSLPSKGKMSLITKAYPNIYNRKWRKLEKTFTLDDLVKAHDIFWEEHETTISSFTFTKNELDHILSKCHQAKIGFTSYFIACLLNDKVDKKSVGLAVDARNDKNKSMSNQVTGISVDYKYNHKLSLIENAIQINKKMKKKLSSPAYKYFVLRFMAGIDESLIDAMNLESYGYYSNPISHKLAKVSGYVDKKKDYSITNLTKLDIPSKYGDIEISKFYFVPPIIAYGRYVIGVGTLNDETTICLHTYKDETSEMMKKDIERAIFKMIEE